LGILTKRGKSLVRALSQKVKREKSIVEMALGANQRLPLYNIFPLTTRMCLRRVTGPTGEVEAHVYMFDKKKRKWAAGAVDK
jgi:hypothetical protein